MDKNSRSYSMKEADGKRINAECFHLFFKNPRTSKQPIVTESRPVVARGQW
jgi:hypothetical protein